MYHSNWALTAVAACGFLVNSGVALADDSKMSSQDQQFVTDAAKGGAMEVYMGQVGEQRGSSQAVKTFSRMIVADHTKANNELKSLAKRKGYTLPPENAHSMANPLAAKSGADFDQAYASHMVEDHQKDIAAFQKEADSGSDPDLKAWASKTLPTLQGHLTAAKALPSK